MPQRRHHSVSPRSCVSRGAVALALLVASLGSLGCTGDVCTVDGEKQVVLEIMQDVYFFNDASDQAAKYASLSLDDFPHADALLDYLRYRPDEYDRGFTYITTPAAEEQFLEDGLFVGFGIGLTMPEGDELFVREVLAGSPAVSAGLARGDEILEIDGRTIAEIEAAEGIGRALGPPLLGYVVEFLIRPIGGGADRTVSIAKDVVTIDAVPDWHVFDVDGEPVGYLLFHVFIPTAVPDLIDAFTDFQDAGVTKIVIDLRYNGGGFVSLAAALNDLLGGVGNLGAVQYRQRFNTNNAYRNIEDVFLEDNLALDVDTIVFITTEETASASELVINALGPYRDVHIVGSTTSGKPVGQTARDYCGGAYRLRVVAFELLNVLYEGGYFGGIDPTCPAADDLTEELGDRSEESLATALAVADTGACPVATASAARAAGPSSAERLGPGPVPWLNAW